jgi:hypothetical protein
MSPLIPAATAFLASLTIYRRKDREAYLRFFPLFLLAVCTQEAISEYRLSIGHGNNLFYYNPYTIFVCCYYFLTIYWIIRSKKVKKIILFILILYPVIAAINILFIQKVNSFHTVTYSLGGLIIVALCIYYFFELFQKTTNVNLLRQPSFWICCGLLFYYSCSFPLYGFNNLLASSASRAVMKNLMFVFQILDVLLYLSFTIAFLCRLRVRKSTS